MIKYTKTCSVLKKLVLHVRYFSKLYNKNYKKYVSGSVTMLLKYSTKIKTIKTLTTLISLRKGNSSKVLIRNYLFGDLYSNILVFIDCLSTAISYLILVSAFILFFCHIIAYNIKLKVYQQHS